MLFLSPVSKFPRKDPIHRARAADVSLWDHQHGDLVGAVYTWQLPVVTMMTPQAVGTGTFRRKIER